MCEIIEWLAATIDCINFIVNKILVRKVSIKRY